MKKYVGIFICLFTVFLMVFFIANILKVKQQEQLAQLQVLNRIALDLPHINLANKFFNQPANERDVKQYISLLNQKFKLNSLINVVGIDGISINATQDKTTKQLALANRTIDVDFIKTYQYGYDLLVVVSVLAFIASLFIVYLMRIGEFHKTDSNLIVNQNFIELDENIPVLKIDLVNKTVSLRSNQNVWASLANKPLCFYLALIEFCIDNPNAVLNPNKDVPTELLELANKYFYRLTQLGHTIRKRPNFTNSLEKTLSEIRAALDEVLAEHVELKDTFYPPKASGEGSRSRLHSYALTKIKASDIEVFGK